jgi:chromosome segregation ATPase
MTDDSESLEDRLDTLEDQVDELDTRTITARIESIETEQEALRGDLSVLVESLREKNEKTPHIESVKQLYDRLESLENNISQLRASLEEVVEEPPSSDEE